MRKLVLKMSVSLDGFVNGANGEIEWIFRTGGEEARNWVLETLRDAGLHAMGHRTYRDMAAFWPFSDSPLAAPMNEIPKVVFTRTGVVDAPSGAESLGDARKGSWAEPFVAAGDLRNEVTRLKAEPGKDILAQGGASFAQALAAEGLIDEYRLLVHPVALGDGLRLFEQLRSPLYLQLASAQSFPGGATALIYHPA